MIIYKTTNIINGKIYIGKDIKNYDKYLGSGIYFKNSLKKYGKDNFIKEILEDNILDKNILNEREIFWINHFNSTDKTIGYNIHIGGQGGDLTKFKTSSLKGKTYEEIFGVEKANERKKNMSLKASGEKNGMYGKKLSEEHIKKIIKANTGRRPNFSEEHIRKLKKLNTGKKASDETKRKMSIAHSSRIHLNGINVQQLDDNLNIIKTFNSIKDASVFFKVHRRKIENNTDQTQKSYSME